MITKNNSCNHLYISDLQVKEASIVGDLLVRCYAAIPGFPSPLEQPSYYEMLANVAKLAQLPSVHVLAARYQSHENEKLEVVRPCHVEERLVGVIVFIGNMADYGVHIPPGYIEAVGMRLLGVLPSVSGQGVGTALVEKCIELATALSKQHVILHTTKYMKGAMSLYEGLGFSRTSELDFMQKELFVMGYALDVHKYITQSLVEKAQDDGSLLNSDN